MSQLSPVKLLAGLSESQLQHLLEHSKQIAITSGGILVREGEILHHHQKVFVPDFVFRHDDGRRVLMEIVGFWTPEYLEAKLATLQLFREHRVLLAVAAPARQTLPDLPGDAIPYKTALRIEDVMKQLEGD